MSWLPREAPGDTPLDRVFGLRENLYEDFRRWSALLWQAPGVDPALLELCRLRIAQIHGCESELRLRHRTALDAGLDEAKVAALARAAHAPELSDRERACIAFAELFCADPHAITDADAAAVGEALGPEGAVALVQALACFDGLARFRLMLEIEPPAQDRLVVRGPAAVGPRY